MAPLAAFHGAKPPAPEWFETALAHAPEWSFVEVEGAKLETLSWGRRGLPGLILLHGGAAHADWWAFIGPLFADRYRVVAPSFSGMGHSDWRPQYEMAQFAREARATGRALGAFDAGPPVVVGHSFGARVAAIVADDLGPEISGAVLVDPPFFAPQNHRPPNPPRASKGHRPHVSLAALVARFRLSPPQPCENPYILDYIARTSARAIRDGEGHERWTLSFDPNFWERLSRFEMAPHLKAARAPLALIRGEKSRLFQTADADHLLSLIPPGSPSLVLPDAEHHVMIDQPLAFVAMVKALLADWPPRR
jgi:pimeloyl-ACP methyl ester carboxylesterase